MTRFNAGEKDVLALAIEAKLTTVKGQVLFNEDGTRTEGTETREVGSEFIARFQLTLEEYEHICNQAKLLIPPKVNVAYHDVKSSTDNYELLIHELAHNTLHSNDHLHKIFYETVTELGAKLAILAKAEPRLFDITTGFVTLTDVQPLSNAAAWAGVYN